MPLVSAKCTSCGASLEVDNTKEAAICPFCETPYIVEKAITNYNTTYRYNVENLKADVVNINTDGSALARINAGDGFMKLKEFDNAYKAYFDASRLTPQDYRTWWGCLRARTYDFTNTSTYSKTLREYQDLAKKAFEFMDGDEKAKYSPVFYNFIRPLNLSLGEAQAAGDKELAALKQQKDQKERELAQCEQVYDAARTAANNKLALFTEASHDYKAGKGKKAFGVALIPLIILAGNIWYGVEEGFNSGFGPIMIGLNGLIVFICLCIMLVSGLAKSNWKQTRDEKNRAEEAENQAYAAYQCKLHEMKELGEQIRNKEEELSKL